MTGEFLNTQQAATLLAVEAKNPRQAVREWCVRWNVPTERRGRRVLIRRVSILEALKRQRRLVCAS